jgi:hypothetical protein
LHTLQEGKKLIKNIKIPPNFSFSAGLESFSTGEKCPATGRKWFYTGIECSATGANSFYTGKGRAATG